jgi:hypothetical protein
VLQTGSQWQAHERTTLEDEEMNVNPVAVMWVCLFTLKVCGLISLTWWIVAPMTLLSAIDLMMCRK